MSKKVLIQKNHVQFYSKGPDSQEPGSIPRIRGLVARNQTQVHGET